MSLQIGRSETSGIWDSLSFSGSITGRRGHPRGSLLCNTLTYKNMEFWKASSTLFKSIAAFLRLGYLQCIF